VACAAALAVLDCIERDRLLDRVIAGGSLLRATLAERFSAHPHVGDVRGRGLFVALEFVEDRASKRPFPRARKLAEAIRAAAMARGLACYPGSGTADGDHGDHVLLAPPFIVGEDEIGVIVDRLAAAIDTVV